jgi:hypothetical protein
LKNLNKREEIIATHSPFLFENAATGHPPQYQFADAGVRDKFIA